LGAKYFWNTGSRDSAISVSQNGDYWLQTVVGECSVIDTVHVSFIPPPQVDLGKDSIFCEGDAFVLDAKNTGAAYKWNTGEETQKILVQKSGTYWVNISVGNCMASDTVRYFPCGANVIMPNAFSPNNNDSLNDYFHVYGTDIYNARLTITNRWGEIIFQTNDIYKGWDGKFKGKKSPVGQYFWTLYYWEYEGNILYPKEKKGRLNLL
jgi:gliding motility-associated-like protein